MSIFRTRSLDIQNARPKQTDFEPPPDLGNLSPNLQPNSPPQFPKNDCYSVSKVGKYLLLEQLEGGQVFRAVNTLSQEELICKVVSLDKYRESLSGHFRLDSHDYINDLVEILLGDNNAYIFLERGYGDLHSYVRTRRRLKEYEASRLFYQIASVVAYCHENGLVLRDLKLRKFIFKNKELTEIKLESLQDTFVLEDEDDDSLSDKHGCPAYVSPEILTTVGKYSGKAADVWSLGVMLYTMLVGRYPFHDSEPSALFTKIRRGTFNLPDSLSSRAKCLIRSILRRDPNERLTAHEILEHPWFRSKFSLDSPSRVEHKMADQTVPDMCTSDDSASLFS